MKKLKNFVAVITLIMCCAFHMAGNVSAATYSTTATESFKSSDGSYTYTITMTRTTTKNFKTYSFATPAVSHAKGTQTNYTMTSMRQHIWGSSESLTTYYPTYTAALAARIGVANSYTQRVPAGNVFVISAGSSTGTYYLVMSGCHYRVSMEIVMKDQNGTTVSRNTHTFEYAPSINELDHSANLERQSG